jgi:hypothetical protein
MYMFSLDRDVKVFKVLVTGRRINSRHVGGIRMSYVGSAESMQSAKWSVQLVPDQAVCRL